MIYNFHHFDYDEKRQEKEIIKMYAERGRGWAQYLMAKEEERRGMMWSPTLKCEVLTDYRFKSMFEWLKKSAESGFSLAQLQLARLYDDKDNPYGVYDQLQATKWFMAAAETLPQAQIALAYRYANGVGLKRNTDKALELIKKAADAGNDKARQLLMENYQYGYFSPADNEKYQEMREEMYGRVYQKLELVINRHEITCNPEPQNSSDNER
ncbi:MAG: hypothetical protein J6A72_02105 [Alistipes sp.]|nr:hypothetical protein [Alistipes sp.]